MKKLLLLLASLSILTFAHAAVPPAEKLLPDDTLMMITVPDFAKARELYKRAPQAQLWQDPAMKAFKDKFVAKFEQELLHPLQRELNVTFSDYTALPQGQLTFAIVQAGWEGKEGQIPAPLLIVDTRDKKEQLTKSLADLKKKWTAAGKTIKTEKIRDTEFFIVPVSAKDLPKTIKRFIPDATENGEDVSESDADATNATAKSELYIGQSASLLLVSTAPKVLERVLSRASGSSVPVLGELSAYQSVHTSLFRDAPMFGWVNTKKFFNVLGSHEKNTDAADADENPFAPNRQKILSAVGLTALQSVSFAVNDSPEGSSANVFLSAPEATRQGLLKILAGEPKESTAPPFVPADAVKFQRWRLDAQKTWNTLEKMLGEISPQAAGVLNYMLDTAGAGAKEKDPDFDLKKNLIGNLGDDIVSYQKRPRGLTLAELSAPPSMFLIGSPKAEQLADAFKVLLSTLGGGSEDNAPKEREFLGRKIHTIQLPALPMASSGGGRKKLSYCASGGYVALSLDDSLIEEYLRGTEKPGSNLRESAGMKEAAQKVAGTGTSLFGYENQAETMRTWMELFKKNPDLFSTRRRFAGIPGGPDAATTDNKDLKDWLDVSLLPGYDKISKYFHFTVYGLTANVDGISLKFFSPAPPQLKK